MRGVSAPLGSSASLIIACDTCAPEAGPASAFLVGAVGKQLVLTWSFRLELLLFTLLEIVMWELQIPEPPCEGVPGSWESREQETAPARDVWAVTGARHSRCWMDPSWLCSYGRGIHSYSHLQMGPLTTGNGFGACRVGCWTPQAVLGFPTNHSHVSQYLGGKAALNFVPSFLTHF